MSLPNTDAHGWTHLGKEAETQPVSPPTRHPYALRQRTTETALHILTTYAENHKEPPTRHAPTTHSQTHIGLYPTARPTVVMGALIIKLHGQSDNQ